VSSYLSFEAIFQKYSKTRDHVDKQSTDSSYKFVSERLQRVQSLCNKWLDVYELYAKGYSIEILSYSKPESIWHLSICSKVIEETLYNVFEAKIPKEAYILLHHIFTELKHGYEFYVLVESDTFKQGSIYEEIRNRSLKNLTVPRPIKPTQIKAALDAIKERDALIIYYEHGQYDNALTWPLLIHECFHWLYQSEQIHQLEDACPKVPWICETLIDIYVTEFFGPAYATSLASYLMLHPHEEAPTYPHFAVRLYTASKYLHDLLKLKKSLPSSINTQIDNALKYIEEVQNHHSEVIEAVSKDIDRIYELTKRPIQELIAQKTRPFTSLIQDVIREHQNSTKLSAEEFLERQVFSIDDVKKYYEQGIPVAANPRILFNSFISDKYLREGIDPLYMKESLKKWYIREFWKREILHK